MSVISSRFGNARPFAGVRSAENNCYNGFQAGFTTYGTADGRETYQTSYAEWGGRSDHLSDALFELSGIPVEPQFVDEAGDDVNYVGTVAMNEARKPKAA